MERIRESSFLLIASGMVRPSGGRIEESRKLQGSTQLIFDLLWRVVFLLILGYGLFATLTGK